MPIKQEDMFLEQLVRRGSRVQDAMKRILILMGAFIVLTLPILFIPQYLTLIEPVLLVVVMLGVWILWRRASKEYEYIYTDGNLDIDVIYSKNGRKHLVTVDAKRCKIICPANDASHKNMLSEKYDKTIMACAGSPDESTYVLIGPYKDKMWKVYFEPNEQLLTALKKYSPRNTVYTVQRK